MNTPKKIVLVVIAALLFGVGSGFYIPTPSQDKAYAYRGERGEVDEFDRMVNSPDRGKINYLLEYPGIDIASRGNLKAKSVFFPKLRGRAVISGKSCMGAGGQA